MRQQVKDRPSQRTDQCGQQGASHQGARDQRPAEADFKGSDVVEEMQVVGREARDIGVEGGRRQKRPESSAQVEDADDRGDPARNHLVSSAPLSSTSATWVARCSMYSGESGSNPRSLVSGRATSGNQQTEIALSRKWRGSTVERTAPLFLRATIASAIAPRCSGKPVRKRPPSRHSRTTRRTKFGRSLRNRR